MRVLRRRHTLGFFVLLAIALQGVLAFAHTHTHTTSLARSGSPATRAITYGMCRANSERPCPAPIQHDDHTKCPICWSMSLAATAVLQAPPAIPLRRPRVEAPVPIRAATLVVGGAFVHFQARAPPLA